MQSEPGFKTDVKLDELLARIGYKFYVSRHIRKETIDAVAKNLGFSSSMISKIENGRYRVIKLEMICRLAAYYELKVTQLLTFEA